MSAIVMATFYVATVGMHNSLNMVAKVLVCLQHHVWSEDDVPLLKRNIEKTITSNNTMFNFIHPALICCSRTCKFGTPLGPQTAHQRGSQAMKSSGLRSGECAGWWDLPSNAPHTSSLASDMAACVAFAVCASALSMKRRLFVMLCLINLDQSANTCFPQFQQLSTK